MVIKFTGLGCVYIDARTVQPRRGPMTFSTPWWAEEGSTVSQGRPRGGRTVKGRAKVVVSGSIQLLGDIYRYLHVGLTPE